MTQTSTLPTPDQIRTLLAFLPVFTAEDFQPVQEWVVSEPDGEGVTHFPYPLYHPAVVDFFQLAGQPPWPDYEYVPAEAARLIADPEYIQTAGLEQIKTLLTYCVRGERFCDGHWESLLQSGTLVRLLQRLEQLV
jgi:hypothetical protein